MVIRKRMGTGHLSFTHLRALSCKFAELRLNIFSDVNLHKQYYDHKNIRLKMKIIKANKVKNCITLSKSNMSLTITRSTLTVFAT
jgi:hypothetical protein